MTSSDGTTHALDHLREGPPVILVCSGSTGRMVNAPLAALLARRFTVLNYNHRVEATAETRRLLGDAPDPTACWSHSLRPDTQAGRLATTWRVVLQSPVRGRRGQPRPWPVMLVADRGYDFDCYRRALRSRGIRPQIARRGTLHGSGLGRLRWVVERGLSWLHRFKRLRVRWEHRADIHEAFPKVACCLVCWRYLQA